MAPGALHLTNLRALDPSEVFQFGQKDRGRKARRRNLSVGVTRRSYNANVLAFLNLSYSR